MNERESISRQSLRFWAKAFAVALILVGGLAAWIYHDLREGFAVRTASDARREEVFLRLPPSASRIGYWRDGINYLAEFDIPEDAFRRLFAEFRFDELSAPLD